MPSVAFSTLNGAGPNHAALGAALGVGGPTAIVTGAVGNIGGVAVPAMLNNIVPTITGRWNIDRSEANRRVYVDAFLNAVVHTWNAAIPVPLMITCEETIGASGARYGHGRLDYLLSALMAMAVIPLWSPSFIIEAKLDLNQGGAAADYGEPQLLAEIVTVRQLGVAAGQGLGNNFLRGALTDGRFWRFYEIDEILGTIRRSPALDTADGGMITVVRILRKFMINWNAAGSLWI
jgi:hypothetical protein